MSRHDSAADPGRLTLHLPYLALVPLDHRVKLRYYDQVQQGLLHGRRVEHLEPIVQDLDSGIEYGPDWLYEDRDSYHKNIEPYPDERDGSFTLRRTLTGRVTRCRVITEICTSAIFENRIITTLEVTLDL